MSTEQPDRPAAPRTHTVTRPAPLPRTVVVMHGRHRGGRPRHRHPWRGRDRRAHDAGAGAHHRGPAGRGLGTAPRLAGLARHLVRARHGVRHPARAPGRDHRLPGQAGRPAAAVHRGRQDITDRCNTGWPAWGSSTDTTSDALSEGRPRQGRRACWPSVLLGDPRGPRWPVLPGDRDVLLRRRRPGIPAAHRRARADQAAARRSRSPSSSTAPSATSS